MAISKKDCLLLLTELQSNGIDCSDKIKSLMKQQEIDLETIKYINSIRPLDATSFYEKLRKSYNNKKSKLYINIVKEEFDNPKDVLTTLGSLTLQILLFSKDVDNLNLFLKQVRFNEITRCLYNYSQTGDLIPCIKLLQLIKIDLKVLEQLNGRNS